MKQKKRCFRAFCSLAIVLFSVLAIYSANEIWNIREGYKAEAEMQNAVMAYKPQPQQVVNQSVIDLQAKYPDVVGWLTVPGTKIDYPFVWHESHDAYLRRDLEGKCAIAGTLFMDARCAQDFTSRNTIIYGHHMKNGSMFGTLKAFADKEFFEANRHGAIYLPHETIRLEFFAYLVVDARDEHIYGELDLDYVKQNARQYREIALGNEAHIVTLSTCGYEFDNARLVLLACIEMRN